MKLKTLSNWFSLLVIGAFVANLVSIGFLIHANGKIDGAYRDREQALQLTHDLRLETERLARYYDQQLGILKAEPNAVSGLSPKLATPATVLPADPPEASRPAAILA